MRNVRDNNGPTTGLSAVFGPIATGLEFNYKNNVTTEMVDPDTSPYTWGVSAEITTDRAYWDIQGIEPSASRPYDQFIVDPPFKDDGTNEPCIPGDEEARTGTATDDGTLGTPTEDGDVTPTPAATPPSNDTNNTRPRAAFTWAPVVPNTTSTVTFTAQASDVDGEIEGYRWEFPNDTTTRKREAEVTHTFGAAGEQRVELTVLDDDGATGNYSAAVEVLDESESANETGNLPPIVWATYEPIAPTEGEAVVFQADGSDSDGNITTLEWLVGGQPVETGESMTITFDEPGEREVGIRATDDDGATAIYNVTVYVQPNVSAAPDDPWAADDPTAFGTCALPAGNSSAERGILLEYWDPSYETVELESTVTWNGTSYELSKTFDEPKGYYFGCIGIGEPVEPGAVAANATANTTVVDEDGNDTTYNDTGIDFGDPGNGLGGAFGGFTLGGPGGLIGPNAGAGAPTWATLLPALAALAYVGYRRYRGDGGSGSSATGTQGSQGTEQAAGRGGLLDRL